MSFALATISSFELYSCFILLLSERVHFKTLLLEHKGVSVHLFVKFDKVILKRKDEFLDLSCFNINSILLHHNQD